MANIIETENLTKDYGNGHGALDINIEVNSGEIVGFIGPNGAGKTTTIRMLTKLIKPNYGKLNLFGHSINSEEDYLKVSNKIGFLSSEGGLYENITPRELLIYAAELYGISVKDKITELANNFKLDLDTKIKYLSLGNKRKVGVIQSIIHSPKLLILDEPTSGLDPLIQQQVLDLIKEVKTKDGGVLLSSHNLAEVESVCDKIVMIKNGKIIFKGRTSEILKKALKRFRIEDASENLFKQIKELKSITKISYIDDEVIAYVEDTREVLDFLIKQNHFNFYLERPTLEETFIEAY